MVLVTLAILFALILLGVPIAVALAAAGLVSALVNGQMAGATAALVAFGSVNSSVLMAIPLYILAGELLSRGKLVRLLVDLAEATFSWIPRGTGVASIGTALFFGGITGSSAADCAAIGGLLYPALGEANYPRRFAAALLATAATFGILVPPSLTMILFGSITQTPVSKLFMAGIVPAIILSIGLAVLVVMLGARYDIQARTRFSPGRFWAKLRVAGWILVVPAIVVGGIYGGIFTPSEAAAVTVVYAVLIVRFVYRNTTFTGLRQATAAALRTTTMIYFLIVGCTLLSFAVTAQRVPQQVSELIGAAHLTPLGFLIVINVLLLFLGLFFDGLSILVMTLPVLFPAAVALGIDPLHLAVVMTVNIEIGVLTPPVGMNLFVISSVSGLTVEEVVRGLVPFFVFLLAGVLLVTYVPELSLWLPRFVR